VNIQYNDKENDALAFDMTLYNFLNYDEKIDVDSAKKCFPKFNEKAEATWNELKKILYQTVENIEAQ